MRCKVSLKVEASDPGSFLTLKNKGGLTKPAASVVAICVETEKSCQRMLAATSGKLPQTPGLVNAFAVAVMQNISLRKVFEELEDHVMDAATGENHKIHLVKEITKTYCKIRFKHLGAEENENSSRKKNSADSF